MYVVYICIVHKIFSDIFFVFVHVHIILRNLDILYFLLIDIIFLDFFVLDEISFTEMFTLITG